MKSIIYKLIYLIMILTYFTAAGLTLFLYYSLGGFFFFLVKSKIHIKCIACQTLKINNRVFFACFSYSIISVAKGSSKAV